jgi:hypothetical protein
MAAICSSFSRSPFGGIMSSDWVALIRAIWARRIGLEILVRKLDVSGQTDTSHVPSESLTSIRKPYAVLTTNFIASCVDFQAAKAAKFSMLEKVATNAFCPLRLRVSAF